MFICDQTSAAAASYLCQIICNRISYSHRLLCLSCRTQSAQVSLYLFTSPAVVISSWRVATVCSNFIVQQVCRVPRYCAGSVGGLTSCSQNHFMELPPSSQLPAPRRRLMSHVCVRTVVETRQHVYNNIVTLEVDPNAREGRQGCNGASLFLRDGNTRKHRGNCTAGSLKQSRPLDDDWAKDRT